MGGIFLVAATVLAVVSLIAMESPRIVTGLLAVAFVVAVSLLGKAVGLTAARLRLVAVHRAVGRRLSESEVPHVDVH